MSVCALAPKDSRKVSSQAIGNCHHPVETIVEGKNVLFLSLKRLARYQKSVLHFFQAVKNLKSH
jgi:hypothetical protein